MRRQYFKSGNYFLTGLVSLFVMVGILTLFTCKQGTDPTPPPSNGFSISGNISLNDPEGPAASATLVLKKDGVNKKSETTNQDGYYTFTDVPPGANYTISVQLQGYLTMTIPSFSVSDNVTEKNLTLAKYVPASSFTVSGTIFADNNKDVLEGASIRLFQDGLSIGSPVITGSDGKYSFPGIDTGDNYTVEASLLGYESSASEAFNVYGKVTGQNLSLTKIVFSVSGTIKANDTSSEIEGAQVKLLQNGFSIGDTETGVDGKYSFAGVNGGAGFAIEVSYTGYEFGFIEAFDVLASGPLTKDLVLEKLTETVYEVSGIISLDSPAGPAVGAYVQLKQGEQNASGTVTTGLDGAYVIKNVKAGNGYTIKVSLEGYEDGVINSINVVDDDVKDKNLTLSRIYYSISGKITLDNPAGGMASGAAVVLKQGASTIKNTSTNASGDYTFTGVTSGANYTINVTLSGYQAGASASFVLNANTSGKNLTLTRIVYTVNGTVSLDKPSGSLSNPTVVLMQGGVNVATMNTSKSGDYSFTDVIPGSNYTVEASFAGYTSKTSAAFNVASADVNGINLALVKIVFTIKGMITREPAGAASGASLTLMQGNNSVATATTSSGGGYTFTEVVPGTYTIKVSLSGYITGTISQFNVTNANRDNMNLELAITGYSVSGKVTLGNASMAANGAQVVLMQSGITKGETTTNSSGAYTFTDVAKGSDYRISASYSGYGSGLIASFSVTNANVTGKDITLLAPINLITNPGLETADNTDPPFVFPAGWSTDAWCTLYGSAKETWSYSTSSATYTGTYTAKFTYETSGGHSGRYVKLVVSNFTAPTYNTVSGALNGGDEGDAKWSFEQSLALVPGKDYMFSDWYRSDVDTKVTVAYQTNEWDSVENDNKWEYFDLPVAYSNTSWTPYNAAFTVPKSAKSGANVKIFHLIEKNGYLDTDDYSLLEYKYTGFGAGKGMITLTFDDAWEENYNTAGKIMKETQYGYRSNQFFMTDSISSPWADHDPYTIIKQFVDDGHEIGAHTRTHSDLTTLPQATMKAIELTGPQTLLQNLLGGLKYGAGYLKDKNVNINYFSSPYGAYNAFVINEIKSCYDIHRTVDIGYNSNDNFDKYRLKCMSILCNTPASEVREWVDKAKNENLWLIVLYHQVNDDSCNCNSLAYPNRDDHIKTSDFRLHMEEVRKSGIAVKTISEALSILGK